MGTWKGWTGTWRLAQRLVLASIGLAAAGQATAAMPGLYFNGFYMDSGLGYSTADISKSDFTQLRTDIWTGYDFEVLDLETESFDRTDIGYSFGVGFQYNDYFAGELSYVQMGEASYSAVGNVRENESGVTYRSRTNLRTRARGLGLSGVGIWPINDNFSLDARGGVLWGKKKLKYSVELQNGAYDVDSFKDGSMALMFGAGVNWSMSPGTAIRAGYLRIAEGLADDRDVSSWVLSLKYAW